jgi:hypothetical protein
VILNEGKLKRCLVSKSTLNLSKEAIEKLMSPENEGLIREVMAREAGRNTLAGYVKYVMDKEAARHHQLICKKLESTLTPGAEKRIVLSAPPGSAKSTYASVAFPSFALAKMPEENLIIAGSYSDELATDFGRKVRNTIKSSEHARLFPDAVLAPDNRAADRFSTLRGTTYYATGIGGPITGKRADILLIDDPVKGRVDADSKAKREAAWKWYSSDALTRLKPGGSIVVIGTRWHENDLIGRILSRPRPLVRSGRTSVFKLSAMIQPTILWVDGWVKLSGQSGRHWSLSVRSSTTQVCRPGTGPHFISNDLLRKKETPSFASGS